MRGLLYCGKCSSTMYSRITKNKEVGYMCGNYFKHGKTSCTRHFVRESEIIDELIKDLGRIIGEETVTARLVNLLEMEFEKEEAVSSINRLEQLLRSRQRQQETLYMDRLDGKISEQLFARINTNIESRIAQLHHEIEKAKKKSGQNTSFEETIDKHLMGIKAEDLTHEIIRQFVNKILVYDPGELSAHAAPSQELFTAANQNGALLIEYKF